MKFIMNSADILLSEWPSEIKELPDRERSLEKYYSRGNKLFLKNKSGEKLVIDSEDISNRFKESDSELVVIMN